MDKKRVVVCVIALLLILLWCAGIYKLSSMNTGNSNGKSTNIIGIFIEDTLEVTNKYGITDSHPDENKLIKATNLLNKPLRKVMHASIFFVLAFIIIFFINYMFHNNKYWLSFLISILLVFTLASLDEYHQSFVDGRTSDFKDVLIDTAGGISGLLFYGTYYYIYRKGYKRGLREKRVNKK